MGGDQNDEKTKQSGGNPHKKKQTDWIGDEGKMSMRINIVEEQKTMADDTGPTTTQKLDGGGGIRAGRK